MSNQSKEVLSLFSTVPYTCYEVAHTWEPSCYKVFTNNVKDSYKQCLMIYIPFYMTNFLLKNGKKSLTNIKSWKNALQDIFRSTLFISSVGTLSMSSFCLSYHFLKKLYGLQSFGVGCFVGYFSYFIEKKSRRKPIALYSSLIAIETLFRMAMSRNIIKPFKNGLIILFCLLNAIFVGLHKSTFMPKDLQLLFNAFLGYCKENLTSQKNSVATILKKALSINHFQNNSFNKLKLFNFKHIGCSHNDSCLSNILNGFLNSFILGFCLDTSFNLMKCITSKHISLKFFKNCSYSCFFTSYIVTLRLISCFFTWLTNGKFTFFRNFISGLFAGLSFYFYRNSTFCVYCCLKLLQIFSEKFFSKTLVTTITNADHHWFALSLGITMHAAYLEPHNIKSSFWNFLCKASKEKFPLLFRKLLDVYGTKASLLYPNHIPKLKKEFVVSSAVKDILIANNQW